MHCLKTQPQILACTGQLGDRMVRVVLFLRPHQIPFRRRRSLCGCCCHFREICCYQQQHQRHLDHHHRSCRVFPTTAGCHSCWTDCLDADEDCFPRRTIDEQQPDESMKIENDDSSRNDFTPSAVILRHCGCSDNRQSGRKWVQESYNSCQERSKAQRKRILSQK